MILCDAGPLVALVDKKDPNHLRCARTFKRLSPPMLTTWPALAEAMYLLGRNGGWNFQAKLWRYVSTDVLRILRLEDDLIKRSRELMEQYRDLPMDLADATLVAVAEAFGLRRIFTLDSDFRIYRLADGSSFEIVP